MAPLDDRPLQILYVSVTTTVTRQLAHNPEDFSQKLAANHGFQTSGHAAIAHHPTSDIDDTLMRTMGATASEMVVMASHKSNIMNHI